MMAALRQTSPDGHVGARAGPDSEQQRRLIVAVRLPRQLQVIEVVVLAVLDGEARLVFKRIEPAGQDGERSQVAPRLSKERQTAHEEEVIVEDAHPPVDLKERLDEGQTIVEAMPEIGIARLGQRIAWSGNFS